MKNCSPLTYNTIFSIHLAFGIYLHKMLKVSSYTYIHKIFFRLNINMHVGVYFICKYTLFSPAIHHYAQQYVKLMGNTFLTGKSQFKVLNMARLEL